MKTFKIAIFLMAAFLVASCTTEDEPTTAAVNIPEKFTVDIPSQISSNANGKLNGRINGDGDGVIEGNEIYESVRYFIWIGEESAEIIEFTLQIATVLEVQNVLTYNFIADDDGREKRIEIDRGVTRAGVNYQYEMTMFDVESGEQALQLLWNNSPVEGIGILNFHNINRSGDANPEAFIRIDYSESNVAYDATMSVSISGLLTPNNGDVDNIKMFVGKNDDVVDIMGNSNHPELVIIDESFTGGRNYAFVGRGDEASDIGVVKLALPPSGVTTDDVLVDYSVSAVLQAEIESAGITDQELIDEILIEAQTPAYFNSAGFITSGVDNKPASFSDSFVDLSGMNPFIPNDVKNLEVDFIQ